MQTSILDCFNAQLCDALTGQATGQEALAWLAEAGLFLIALKDQEGWYRYTEYVATLLRALLEQIAPARIPHLHQRAVVWYEQRQMPVEAIKHAQQAQDGEQLAYLLERYGEPLLHQGHMAFVASALAALPPSRVIERPLLGCLHAFTLLATGRFEQCAQIILHYEQFWISNANAPLWARIGNLRAFLSLFRGEPCQGIEHARGSLEMALEEDWPARSSAKVLLALGYLHTGDLAQAADELQEAYHWSLHTRSMMALQLVTLVRGELQLARGQLHEAERAFQQLLKETEGTWAWVQALAYARLGEIFWQWNNIAQAQEQCQQAIHLIEQYALEEWICALPHLLSAQLAWDRGECEQAALRLGRAEQMVRRWGSPQLLQAQVAELRVRFWLQQDHSQQTREELPVPAWEAIHLPEWSLIQVRLYRQQGALNQASELLQELRDAAHTQGHIDQEIAALIQLALVSAAQSDKTLAFRSLERALILAEPGGYIRSFAIEGEPMAALLTSYIHLPRHKAARTKTPCSPFYIRRIKSALGIEGHTQSLSALQAGHCARREESVRIESLSERERAVLELIVRGYSNAQIAQQLVLTVHTVKTHLRNIYAKMQVHSRVQAVIKANESRLSSFS